MMRIEFRGQTTLITGASSGIGAAFARALAARGSNVILVARRRDRLESLAGELERAHSIKATPIELDLSVSGAGRALAAETANRGLEVTSLINNAGFGTDGPFHLEDAQRVEQEITLDVTNLVDVTRAFIEPLRQVGTGVVINVASMAAYNPIPGMAVYAACKAFVLNFTEALWYESRGTGLRILSLAPGATRTEFFDVLGGGEYDTNFQTPEEVVAAALRSLDHGNKRPSITTRALNTFLVALARLVPRKRTVILAAGLARRTAAPASHAK